MSKNKLDKFAENLIFRNVIEVKALPSTPDCGFKGRWNKDFFKNDNPIVLELGCGKGEYTIGLARKHSDKNYIGMDIKGARLWRGAKTALEDSITNVAFVRTRIEFIEKIFAPNEISEIWITFPDPQYAKENKRLTSPMFLERYRKVLSEKGIINLKTDDTLLYEYTLNDVVLQHGHDKLFSTNDLYNPQTEYMEMMDIKTFYEQMWLSEGRKIKYISFRLK